MNRIMLDCETLGVSSSPVILSIGAVRFDLDGIKDEYYTRVKPESCVKSGLKMDVSTILWWMGQSEAARAEVIQPFENDDCDLFYAAMNVRDWMTELFREENESPLRVDEVWGNGSDSDNVWLANAMNTVEIVPPWTFRQNRCYRTLKNLYPQVPLPERQGTEHNALDDARFQALHCIELLKHAAR